MSAFRRRAPTEASAAAGGSASRSPLPGVRPSAVNGLPLLSTGLLELDQIFSGGIPAGGIFLIEEDRNTNFHAILLRYFMAEGFACGHSVQVISADAPPDALLAALPACVGGPAAGAGASPAERPASSTAATPGANGGSAEDAAGLRIAWRYRRYLAGDAAAAGPAGAGEDDGEVASFAVAAGSLSLAAGAPVFCHDFDLSAPMDPASLGAARRAAALESVYPPASFGAARGGGGPYESLFPRVRSFVEGLAAQQEPARRVGRIAIHSLGSPAWGLDPSSPNDARPLLRFLHAARGLLRRSPSPVALAATVPSHLLPPRTSRGLLHLADAALSLESFSGGLHAGESAPPPDFREFHGLVRATRLPGHRLLCPALPDTLSFGFALKRRRLRIERLHPPPDATGEARAQGAEVSKAAAGTGGGGGGGLLCAAPNKASALDF